MWAIIPLDQGHILHDPALDDRWKICATGEARTRDPASTTSLPNGQKWEGKEQEKEEKEEKEQGGKEMRKWTK